MEINAPPFSGDLPYYRQRIPSTDDEDSSSENCFDFSVVDNTFTFEKDSTVEDGPVDIHFERLQAIRIASKSIEKSLVDIYLKKKSKIDAECISKNEASFSYNYVEKIAARGNLHYIILTLFTDGYNIHCNGPDFDVDILCGVGWFTEDNEFDNILDDIDKGELPSIVYDKIIIHENYSHLFFHNFYVFVQTLLFTSRNDNEPLFSRFDLLKSSQEVQSALTDEFDRDFEADLYPNSTDKSFTMLMEEINLLQFGPIFTDPDEFGAVDFSGLLGVRRNAKKPLMKDNYLKRQELNVQIDELPSDSSESGSELEIESESGSELEKESETEDDSGSDIEPPKMIMMEKFKKTLALREMKSEDMIMCRSLDMFLVEVFYYFRIMDKKNLKADAMHEEEEKLKYRIFVFWKDRMFYICLSLGTFFMLPCKEQIRLMGTKAELDEYILQSYEWVSNIFFTMQIYRINKFQFENNQIHFGPKRKFFRITSQNFHAEVNEDIYDSPDTSSSSLLLDKHPEENRLNASGIFDNQSAVKRSVLSDTDLEENQAMTKKLKFVDEYDMKHKNSPNVASETSTMDSKETKVMPKWPGVCALDRSTLFSQRHSVRLRNVSEETLKCISLNDTPHPKHRSSASKGIHSLAARFEDSNDGSHTSYPDIPGRVYIHTVVEDDTTVTIFEANDIEIDDSTFVFTFPKDRRDITKAIRVIPSARCKFKAKVPRTKYDFGVNIKDIKVVQEMLTNFVKGKV